MSLARRLIAHGTYPAALLSAPLAVGLVLERWPGSRGWETVVASTGLLATLLGLMALQRLSPHTEAWRDWAGDLATDAAHSALSATLGTTAARVTLFAAMGLLASATGGWGLGLWPTGWPLLAQLPLAVVISDLGMYVLHRASHEVPVLWRLHAVHHSSERLYTVSSGRVHPIYVALAVLVASGPILVLGAPPPLFSLLSTFVGVNGLVQHSNVALDCRPWRWLLATADAHRWHHSSEPADGRYNYGNTLSLWDRLFGTWRVPEGQPKAIGLGDRTFPTGWIGQLTRPFAR